jgi:hypothetical protein
MIQPVVSRFELEVPLCKTDQREESWQRGQIFLAHDTHRGSEDETELAKRNLDQDKVLLQLINAACDQDKLMRALDLAMLIKSDKALEASITLANRHRKRALAEKIGLYRQERMAEQEAAEQEEEYEEEEVEDDRYQGPHHADRPVKRARFAEEQHEEEHGDVEEVGSDDGERDNTDGNDTLETPPGPAANAVRRPASIFAVKNPSAQVRMRMHVLVCVCACAFAFACVRVCLLAVL